jgi:hypothetical protein
MVSFMKTTQDSNQDKVQEDQVTLESKQKLQQTDSQQLAGHDIDQSIAELENTTGVEQLDLALADGNTNDKPTEAKDKIKKSKKADKKAEDETVIDEQLLSEVDEQVASTQEQSEQSVDELPEEISEESLISEALQDQDASVSAGGSALSMTTIALGTVSLFGVATYYKNTNKRLLLLPAIVLLSRKIVVRDRLFTLLPLLMKRKQVLPIVCHLIVIRRSILIL